VSGRFDPDAVGRDVQSLREAFAHRGDMRADLGLFSNKRGIDVDDGKALSGQNRLNPAQYFLAIYPLYRVIRIRKMMANVSIPGSAEERVRDRMRQDIGIGMPI